MPPQPSWTRSHASAPVVPADSATRAPAGVCRTALDSRLRTTRVSSVSLPATVGQRSGSSATTSTPAAAAAAASAATASETTSPSASGTSSSRRAAEVARESWNRSSTMAASRMVSRRTRAR